MDLWQEDIIRRRVTRFWSMRTTNEWPLEVQDWVFLGNAILQVGSSIFPNWTGLEPAQAALPVLNGVHPPVADGFDSAYALTLLIEHKPDIVSSPEAMLARWTASLNPLTQEQWEAAFEIYREVVATEHAQAIDRVRTVRRLILEAASRQEIFLGTRSAIGTFSPSPREHWQSEMLVWRFLECQMYPTQPYDWPMPSLENALNLEDGFSLLPGAEWIYVDRCSLRSFLNSLRTNRDSPRRQIAPQIETKHVTDERLDAALKDIYARVAGGEIRYGNRGYVVGLVRNEYDLSAPVEKIRQRFTATKPSWWKSGPHTSNPDGQS